MIKSLSIELSRFALQLFYFSGELTVVMSFAANYPLIGQVCKNSVPLLIFQSMIPICRISASSLFRAELVGPLPVTTRTSSCENLHEILINNWTDIQAKITTTLAGIKFSMRP